MSQYLINFILEASHKISGLLYRDYTEIEKLSVNSRTISFVDKSLERSFDMLAEALGRYSRNSAVILSHEFINVEKSEDKPQILFVVTPIDALGNFTKALNFFGITIVAMELNKDNTYTTKAAVVNFPTLKQSCYSYENGGLWLKDFGFDNKNVRLKVKSNQTIQNWLVISDRAQNFNAPISINNLAINKLAFRNFGSITFASLLFFSNKADCIIYTNIDRANLEAIKLFAKEGGALLSQFKAGSTYWLLTNYDIKIAEKSLEPPIKIKL